MDYEKPTDQDYLRMIDARLNGLQINNPDSPEVARLRAARADVESRIANID